MATAGKFCEIFFALCFIATALNLDLIRAEVEPEIFSPTDFVNFQQTRAGHDARPRLSASQQAQILSDVQQHQQRFTSPSLSKYKVDRSKQAQIQTLLQQQQQIQQLIQDQQRKIAQQLNNNAQYFPHFEPQAHNSDPSRQFKSLAQQQSQQRPSFQQQNLGNIENLGNNGNNGGDNLHNLYVEKQRELQALQKQRQQLLLEQQTLKRQQEILRQQKFAQNATTKSFSSTTTTTTTSPVLVSLPAARKITPTESELFLRAIQTHQRKFSGGGTTPVLSTTLVASTTPALATTRSEEKIEASEVKATDSKPSQKPRQSTINADRDQLLRQLKLALSQSIESDSRNVSTRDIFLPNSAKLQLIESKTTFSPVSSTVGQISTTIKPPKAILDELTRGVLPPGAEFEVIRQKSDGKLEEIGKTPLQSLPGRKVTFVVLEEQLDGSYKVQGVKGNAGKEGGDVESIVERIRKGELKLPPSSTSSGNSSGRSLEKERNGTTRISGGTRNIWGVKGNAGKERGDAVSIVERIRKGELKLPPSSASSGNNNRRNLAKERNGTTRISGGTSKSPEFFSHATSSSILTPTTTDKYESSASSVSSHVFNQFSPITPKFSMVENSAKFSSSTRSHFIPTMAPVNEIITTTSATTIFGDNYFEFLPTKSAENSGNFNLKATQIAENPGNFDLKTNLRGKLEEDSGNFNLKANLGENSNVRANLNSRPLEIEENLGNSNLKALKASEIEGNLRNSDLNSKPSEIDGNLMNSNIKTPIIAENSRNAKTTIGLNFGTKGGNNEVILSNERDFGRSTVAPSTKSEINENLNGLLRKEGLFAMAKYLRQSGLDNVLNETGPYTIFVPTDKAFRTLLVQLGGPEKAEQKFKENPRLLSGLLLHHVIPGAFRISSLQDEMTGVSLAGTQLRVNEYAMHDHEWNDIKVTTINGAKVAPNKRDIEIPQGVAHAIDRVMFPLPVGDLVQTLQADRERRFTVFLKILSASGLQETLTGPKTFTVFAPMDAAFESAAKDGTPVWTETDGPEVAKTVISRHVIPSTLYTAGMRYYLQKDSLRPQSPVHIHKNGGRVRVNEAHVVTHNVPATNGVLHAIDAVL